MADSSVEDAMNACFGDSSDSDSDGDTDSDDNNNNTNIVSSGSSTNNGAAETTQQFAQVVADLLKPFVDMRSSWLKVGHDCAAVFRTLEEICSPLP